ncbi:MAG: type II toxin-antitoxin system HigB family toxin [Kordiimonadaceae bacterium]|nr:type II toxin-antitoxin system HigB family toxin [Kordiimonadaceae bacterium]
MWEIKGMRIIARKTLKDFWELPNRGDAEQPLKSWYAEVNAAEWGTPAHIKQQFRSASILKNNRVVFNIAGNKYRLIVWVSKDYTVCLIRFIGTHKEYDKIDAETI